MNGVKNLVNRTLIASLNNYQVDFLAISWKKAIGGRGTVVPAIDCMSDAQQKITLVLTHEEATELFFRCLKSPDEDSPLSERVLSKLARALAEADETELRMAV